jgi:ABC-2 type transport system permease protein
MSATVTAAQDVRATAPIPSAARQLAALVRRGLLDQRRAPLTWGGALGAMTALMAAIWPSIEHSMSKLLDSYPSGLKEAFGIQQLDSIEKYIDAEMLSVIVPLALVFFAVRSATRTTVGAEEAGHLDTLLSLPVSRRLLVASAFVVTGLVLAAILAVVWTLTWIAGTTVGGGISATTLAAGLVNVWPLAMAFGGLAILAAGVSGRASTVTAVALGIAATMYVIDLAGKLSDPLRPLRAASAFRYYGSAINDGLDVTHMLVLTLGAVALAAAGAQLFARRDLG